MLFLFSPYSGGLCKVRCLFDVAAKEGQCPFWEPAAYTFPIYQLKVVLVWNIAVRAEGTGGVGPEKRDSLAADQSCPLLPPHRAMVPTSRSDSGRSLGARKSRFGLLDLTAPLRRQSSLLLI